MSDPLRMDKVIRKIKRKWDDDPEGWRVLSNMDKDGNREMLISQQPNTWWLKMKTVSAHQNMVYGKEIKNLDDEINFKLGEAGEGQSQKDLVQLFGMAVPIHEKEDVVVVSGVEKIDPKLVNHQKEKIEEKESDADKLFRLYLRKKWEREQQLRDNMYL